MKQFKNPTQAYIEGKKSGYAKGMAEGFIAFGLVAELALYNIWPEGEETICEIMPKFEPEVKRMFADEFGNDPQEVVDKAEWYTREMMKRLEENRKMKVVLDEGAFMPEYAHDTDAGADLRSPVSFNIMAGDSVTIDTGVHVEIPSGFVGMLKSKSGLNVKHGIVSEGVIDAGYTGSIRVKLYNHGLGAFTVLKGDKISQLVIMPVHHAKFELSDALDETERGDGGFGSTGR